MRPLVAVRRAVEFDSRFLERDALFWPLARAARALGPHDDFPPVEEFPRVFEAHPPVRFVAPNPRRRRGSPVDVNALYDGRITIERAVPTRPRCWHDLMNALVWGTFPKAKLALHARQHRLIAKRIGPDARGLPPRSRELDALALVDEGGVVVLASDPEAAQASLRTGRPGMLGAMVESGAADALVFGHAIYESLALGVKPAVVAAVVLGREEGHANLVGMADDLLSVALHEGRQLGSPRELTRVEAVEARPVRRMSHSDLRVSHVDGRRRA
ncbi:MAG: DUF3025 domain-containing protein [Polyangiaceae bacterium]